MICVSRRRPFTHLLVAYISTSAELRAVIFCRLDTQWMGPFCMMMKPDMEWFIKGSIAIVSLGFGTLWSWAPQLASQSERSLEGSTGNLRKADMDVLILLENEIPLFLVPLMYLITYLAALICCFVAWWVCQLNMEVMVARSGHVPPEIYKREPTMVYIWWVMMCWSHWDVCL